MKIGDVEVLSLSKAAERAKLSTSTLRTQIKAGVIPAIKEGVHYYIEAGELEKYINEHKGKHGYASPNHTGRRGRRKKGSVPNAD
jgi:excisionase family DNA binding protein